MQLTRVVVDPPIRSGSQQVPVGRTILDIARRADVLEFGRRAGAWDDVTWVALSATRRRASTRS